MPEYVWICLDRVLNISWVLNMTGLWIWQGSDNARVTQSIPQNIPQNDWICRNDWISICMI